MTEFVTEHDLSVRPNIFGFSLETLESLLGSVDLDLFGRLTLALMEREEGGDELTETIDQARKVLEEAIRKGAPFPGLVSETEPHVMAAITLAQHDQELTPTGSDSWQVSAFWALAEQYALELEPEPRRLLAYFCEGRPLFGKIIETDRRYYGYLSLNEVKTLTTEMAQLEEHIKDWEDAAMLDFVRDFLVWLNAVDEADQDLWFHAG